MRIFRNLVLLSLAASASTAGFCQAPSIQKVDPPDWWVNIPAPMLLLHGEHLRGATFQLSGDVHIARTSSSENGHWAELWLANEPTQPVHIEITAVNADGKTIVPFRFTTRR